MIILLIIFGVCSWCVGCLKYLVLGVRGQNIRKLTGAAKSNGDICDCILLKWIADWDQFECVQKNRILELGCAAKMPILMLQSPNILEHPTYILWIRKVDQRMMKPLDRGDQAISNARP